MFFTDSPRGVQIVYIQGEQNTQQVRFSQLSLVSDWLPVLLLHRRHLHLARPLPRQEEQADAGEGARLGKQEPLPQGTNIFV